MAGLSATVALLLVAGTSISSYYAINANRENIRAEAKRQEAESARQAALESESKAKASAKEADEKREEAENEKNRRLEDRAKNLATVTPETAREYLDELKNNPAKKVHEVLKKQLQENLALSPKEKNRLRLGLLSDPEQSEQIADFVLSTYGLKLDPQELLADLQRTSPA